MSAPQKPEPGPRASLDRMREELTAGDLTHARTHALAAIAEALVQLVDPQPEPDPTPSPYTIVGLPPGRWCTRCRRYHHASACR